ncbi:MAG: hypothetical protein M3Q14_02410 [bacterium]|nr:hypothetical protein [bacterium]
MKFEIHYIHTEHARPVEKKQYDPIFGRQVLQAAEIQPKYELSRPVDMHQYADPGTQTIRGQE